MRLVRFGASGAEKPGILDEVGRVRDLSGVLPDISAEFLSPETMSRLKRIEVGTLPLVSPTERLGPCIGAVRNFICIGLNYTDHALEANLPIPSEPVIFNKHTAALSGAYDPIIMPPDAHKLDWEVELAVVIGRPAWHVLEKHALSYVAGYSLFNDVSERSFQLEMQGQWSKGKSYPSFGPLGPWLVTAEEIADPQKIDLWLDLNGTRLQSGTTAKMIFSAAQVVSYLSRFMELQPGDVIPTGTPAGVGMGCKPPRYLQLGDAITLGGTGLGSQKQQVVPWSKSRECSPCQY
jgi:2,4-didehydro-3-deoxy-L-rhamnonate hydrolase